MLLHYSTPFFEGDAVPFPLLGEGIHEEIGGADGFGICCLAEIFRGSNHREVGIWCCEKPSETRFQELGVKALNILH